MDVDVKLQSIVKKITSEAVHLNDGETIPAETVAWTAGVQGDGIVKSWRLPMDHKGHVSVLPTLQVKEYPNVYVIGDLAYFEEEGHPLPMIAPVAIQQGVTAALNIVRQIEGLDCQSFHYHDKGIMVAIG